MINNLYLIIELFIMDYVSCFSGIGGLDGDYAPIGFSEIDNTCNDYLQKKYPKAKNLGDIKTAEILKCDVLTAGWPCQDISIAGQGEGLKGENSKLFYNMVKYAKLSSAHTIIAENVKNILRIENGKVFKEVLNEFKKEGFKFCSWRTLNTRQFGLPHHRNRVFFIASKNEEICLSLFRKINIKIPKIISNTQAFYWTAGTHSLNFSKGYIPTLKLGGNFETPCSIAIFKKSKLKVLKGSEALALQGFNPTEFKNIKNGKLVNLAGNAVSVPVGRFVFESLKKKENTNLKWMNMSRDLFDNDFVNSSQKNPEVGFFDGEIHVPIIEKIKAMVSNLDNFIDDDFDTELSKRASSGLLRRLSLSKTFCPEDLRNKLVELSKNE